MNRKTIEDWLDQVEQDPRFKEPDEKMAERIFKKAFEQVPDSGTIQPEKPKVGKGKKVKHCRSVSRWKAAGIIIAVAAALMIPTVTYATITGRISGAFWPSPEVEKMIDRENPVREPLDVPETEVEIDQFANSSILNENSYPHPELLGIVTDVAMEPVNEGYFLSGIVFDRENTMVLTKEDGEGWQLEEGDELSISVSIDTEFAASEEDGEYILFGYALNGIYTDQFCERISDSLYTFTFTAPETGEYYMCLENLSATYIKITHLEIS